MMSPPWIIIGWAVLILIVIAVMTAAIVATLMVRSRNRHWREFHADRHRQRTPGDTVPPPTPSPRTARYREGGK